MLHRIIQLGSSAAGIPEFLFMGLGIGEEAVVVQPPGDGWTLFNRPTTFTLDDRATTFTLPHRPTTWTLEE